MIDAHELVLFISDSVFISLVVDRISIKITHGIILKFITLERLFNNDIIECVWSDYFESECFKNIVSLGLSYYKLFDNYFDWKKK